MINIIVELSKYLMIALMLVYTFECFAVFNYTDEYTQRSIFRKQNVLMFLLHIQVLHHLTLIFLTLLLNLHIDFRLLDIIHNIP